MDKHGSQFNLIVVLTAAVLALSVGIQILSNPNFQPLKAIKWNFNKALGWSNQV
jgi:hypothetical protein